MPTTQNKLKDIVYQKNKFIDSQLALLEKNFDELAPGILKQLRALITSGNYDYNAIRAVFVSAGIDAQLGAFVESYAETIQYTKIMAEEMGLAFGMTERGLDLIGRLQEQGLTKLLTRKDAIAQSLTDAALKWEVDKAPLKRIVAELSEGLTDLKRRIGTEALTGISLFEQAVKVEQFRDAGIERYMYVGPPASDPVIRDSCKEVMGMEQNTTTGFTEDEIANLPVGFIDRGGWNCRHDWIPYVS